MLAVPDTHIGKVAAGIEKKLKPGTMVIVLDAAAPFAGHLPERPDLTYFITHPCHPPIFNDETDMEAKQDYFGGVKAKQHIVSALMQGPEARLRQVARRSPRRSGRRSCARTASRSSSWPCWSPACPRPCAPRCSTSCARRSTRWCARGVDRQAALDFLLGHMNVLGAVIFGEIQGVFSDACNKAIEFGKPRL